MVNTFIITGSTGSYRDILKRLEGRWVPHLNAWLLPETERDSVSRLRSQTSLDIRLITLPIDLPGSCKAAAAARSKAAASRLRSPTAR